jgi:2-polyprenyl-6-hydroxyphenyl methylase / 3-demethylubiquinone-9 3-methyltransferase
MATTPRVELNSRSPEAIDGREIRAVAFQEVRLEYVRGAMGRLGIASPGSRALVVGGGRGTLPRGLARLGLEVVAIDPSQTATEMAREAAERAGLDIAHRTAPAEDPGVPESTFDIAYYADTFEITSDLAQVVESAARALKPGGVLFYDTVNRTLLSRLIYLGAFQGIPMTRIVPRGRYAAVRLRKPAEVAEVLDRSGLRNEDISGFKPKKVPSLIKAVLARRRGDITDDEVASMVDFVLDPDGRPVVTYLGLARKR